MKKLLIAALILIPISAHCAEDWQENCEVVGDLAYAIMHARQQGAPLPAIMEVAADDELSRKMVADAYDLPKYTLDESKAEAADEFRDKWYLDCYKVLTENK